MYVKICVFYRHNTNRRRMRREDERVKSSDKRKMEKREMKMKRVKNEKRNNMDTTFSKLGPAGLNLFFSLYWSEVSGAERRS